MSVDLTNLISYWPLNESSNGSAPVTRADAHNGNDLTDNDNKPSGTGLVYSLAADFPTAGALIHTDNAPLSMGNIDFTFAAWANLSDKTANRFILSKGNILGGGSEYRLYYDQPTNRFTMSVNGSLANGDGSLARADGLGSPSVDTWYFVVGWYDSTANLTRICVNDGTVTDGQAQSLGAVDGDGIFAVGYALGVDEFWLGQIGPVMVWKRLLTSGEITTLYNGGAGLTYAAMSGERRFLLVR